MLAHPGITDTIVGGVYVPAGFTQQVCPKRVPPAAAESNRNPSLLTSPNNYNPKPLNFPSQIQGFVSGTTPSVMARVTTIADAGFNPAFVDRAVTPLM